MKKRLKRTNMTRFDYNIRVFSFIIGVLFIATLAFIAPLAEEVNNKTILNEKKIALLRVENNILKLHLDETIKDIKNLFR